MSSRPERTSYSASALSFIVPCFARNASIFFASSCSVFSNSSSLPNKLERSQQYAGSISSLFFSLISAIFLPSSIFLDGTISAVFLLILMCRTYCGCALSLRSMALPSCLPLCAMRYMQVYFMKVAFMCLDAEVMRQQSYICRRFWVLF